MAEEKEGGSSIEAKWRRMTSAEADPGSRQVCYTGGTLYLLGGQQFMTKYSFSSEKWHQLSCPLKPRQHFLLLAFQECLFLYGG
jgi:hypothetical protein